jgi:hypothetical protein
MRDPDGSLSFEEAAVHRSLREPLNDSHFLRSALARRWMADGRLVKFEIADPHTVIAERLPFVTHPSEWSDAQLHAAAQLTLQLQTEAVMEGFDLKDASAWNIIFDGTRPMFCDLLSLVPFGSRKWWAAGQFARHFVVPLALSRRRGLHGYQCFQIWRDGVPPDAARGLYGTGRFLTRYWPLMTQGKAAPEAALSAALSAAHGDDSETPEAIASFRTGLHATLGWMLRGGGPRVAR